MGQRPRASAIGFRLRGLLLAGVAIVGAQVTAFAQEQEAPPQPKGAPLLVVTFASVERMLQDVDYMFASIGRPELSESMTGALARVRDLKGVNRDQSAGLMLFLNGLVPQAVGFVPVDNVEDLMKTVTFGPITTTKIGDDRYEIRGSRGSQSVEVKVVGKYAFVSNEPTALDRDFSNPAAFTNRLTSRYDFAASINLKALPQATKDILLDFSRASAEASLQRRDDEPEIAHEMRHAAGMANIEAFETLVTETEEITIGWSISDKEKSASLELVIKATPKSEYAKYIDEMRAVRSHFANLLTESVPLTISSAIQMDKPTKKAVKAMLVAGEKEMVARLGSEEATAAAIKELFAALNASAEQGKIDFCAQFQSKSDEPFVFLGGVRIQQGERLVTGLDKLLDLVKSNPDIKLVQKNISTHNGVTFHRIQGSEARPQDEVLYGEAPSLYVGLSNEAIWFAVGGDSALIKLKAAIDKVAQPAEDQTAVAPFQVLARLSRWLELMDANNGDAEFLDAAEAAFSKGGDTIRLDLRPIDDGLRIRLTFDEGFIRLIGEQIARQIDEGG